MSVFYKCYKRTHEVNDPDAPVYRAVKWPQESLETDRYILDTLCNGVRSQANLFGFDGYIVELPFEKMPDGNIKYLVLTESGFRKKFTPHTVDPWILSGGIDLSKCD